MNLGRAGPFALILGIAVLAVMGWAGWSATERSLVMTPKDMSATAFADAAPGAPVHVVIEVASIDTGGQLRGRLLEEHGHEYRRTSVSVVAQLTADSAVLMGAAADIKPHAVLELSGRFAGHHLVRVARIVVLTGYVTLER
jgi:hypothetical protein